MSRRRQWKNASAVFLLCAATAIAAPAQTFTTLVNLNNTSTANPYFVSLVQGPDGDFYGTGQNTVFKITPRGALTTLSFVCCAADAGLVLATDGNFYGTTSMGGYGCGTVFEITATGALITLYSFFGNADGCSPMGALIQDTNRTFYGTAQQGGEYPDCGNGCGTIFGITSEGKLTALHAFEYPQGYPIAGLVQGTDGNLYGAEGGSSDPGAIFKISPNGTFTTLHSFNETDGLAPYGKLVEAPDGNFYGTTWGGGANGNYGTVFKITRQGKLTTLYSFCAQANCQDGAFPWDGLVLGTDGNLYGTTWGGGADFVDCTSFQVGCGTVFQITPKGVLTTLHSFDVTDGAYPYGGLVQGTTGVFYGTTSTGGVPTPSPAGAGTIFSLDVGLGPFVTFVQAAGKVGQTGGILGQELTGTTSVSLNGTPANFTVVSDTFLKATVPPGATTGYVTVTTPSGTFTSNVPFHVIK